MSMNVNTTGTVYGSYQNTYKAGTVDKKKETAKTTENDKVKKNVTESIAEKNLSKEAQKMLKDMRGSRTDMDFMVADFENEISVFLCLCIFCVQLIEYIKQK